MTKLSPSHTARVKARLASIGLDADNAIVIGSGVMGAYGIRQSHDIDVVVDEAQYARLKRTGDFQEKDHYGRPVLLHDELEVSTCWHAVGIMRSLRELAQHSVVIEGVRYTSLDFLLAVKKGWIAEEDGRPKDKDDVRLIETYLQSMK